MRIIFYDKKELIIPDNKDVEELLLAEFDLAFHTMEADSKTVGSILVDFLNSDCTTDDYNKLTQDLFKQAVDYCVSINPGITKLQELSPKQRLYLYQKYATHQRIEFILKTLKIRYQVVSEKIELENNNYFMVEMAESNDMASIYYLELIKMVSRNIYIRKCDYCKKYFLIDGRRKTVKYCDRIPEGKTQPCFALAARQHYEQKLENDFVTKAYRSAYKKFYQRIRIGKWTAAQFESWSGKAKDKLKQCKDGSITDAEFIKWLKEDI